VVLSHVNPPQVIRLIRVLLGGSGHSRVVLHHDETSSHLDPQLLSEFSKVHRIRSIPIAWGNFSLVDVVLRAIEWSLSHLEFDWLVLLSGQDYPIRPLPEIERFLATTSYDGFLKGFPLGSRPETAREDYQRYLYRYYRVPAPSRLFPRPGRADSTGATVARRLREAQPMFSLKRGPSGVFVGIRRLHLPFDDQFRWYRGSTWFTLSRRSVEALHGFARSNARLMRYFGRMWIPEESFVPTVLLNQPDLRLYLDHLRFIRFRGGRHPDILSSEDADEVLSSGKHFGRKFDSNVDGRILDLIDARVHATSLR
jgi:Core-2/I-Branching enzyme